MPQAGVRVCWLCPIAFGLTCLVTSALAEPLPTVGDGSSGLVLNGIDEIDFSGWSVGGTGNLNGDVIDDLITGADAAKYMAMDRPCGQPMT